jgi:hypothetical protein
VTYERTDEIRAFLQEKQYLQNISVTTIVLYESCFQAFDGAVENLEAIKGRVVESQERGVSPVTVNTYLRHVKCFYLWRGNEWKIPDQRKNRKSSPRYQQTTSRPSFGTKQPAQTFCAPTWWH